VLQCSSALQQQNTCVVLYSQVQHHCKESAKTCNRHTQAMFSSTARHEDCQHCVHKASNQLGKMATAHNKPRLLLTWQQHPSWCTGSALCCRTILISVQHATLHLLRQRISSRCSCSSCRQSSITRSDNTVSGHTPLEVTAVAAATQHRAASCQPMSSTDPAVRHTYTR
jgi:hypothetical protein